MYLYSNSHTLTLCPSPTRPPPPPTALAPINGNPVPLLRAAGRVVLAHIPQKERGGRGWRSGRQEGGGAPEFMCACKKKKKKLGGWRKLRRKVKMWEKQIRGGELVGSLMEPDTKLRLQEKTNLALSSTGVVMTSTVENDITQPATRSCVLLSFWNSSPPPIPRGRNYYLPCRRTFKLKSEWAHSLSTSSFCASASSRLLQM